MTTIAIFPPTLSGGNHINNVTIDTSLTTSNIIASNATITSSLIASNATINTSLTTNNITSSNATIIGRLTTSNATITGSLTSTNATITGNLTASNVTCLGTTTTINTQEIVSSNVSITNAGTGPALFVKQTGVNDIADFQDENGSILKISDSGAVTIGGTGSGLSQKVAITGNVYSSGTVSATSFIGSGSNLTGMSWITSGSNVYTASNVGIGTTSPLYALDVVGNSRLTGGGGPVLQTNQYIIGSGTVATNITIGAYISFSPALSKPAIITISAPTNIPSGCTIVPDAVSTTAGFSWSCKNLSGSLQNYSTWSFTWTATPYYALDVVGNLNVSGIITGKPAGVRFTAISTGTSTAAGGVLPYNSVLVNIGGGYNASTYTFTAPITGVYTLYASFNNPSWVAWYINGTAWAGLYQYTVLNMQISLSLSVGTTVCLYSGGAVGLSYQHSFSGYLEPYTS